MCNSEAIANSYCLVFSISPCKKVDKLKNNKKREEEEEEENILTLAPFTKAPKINFGQVNQNESIERNLLIINPQNFDLELNVTNSDLNINNLKLNIKKGENLNLKIKWQPVKVDNYKYSILFEVINAARLKFLVHAFGQCININNKLKMKSNKTRKPFTMLQPIRKQPISKQQIEQTIEHKIEITKSNSNSNITFSKNDTILNLHHDYDNYDVNNENFNYRRQTCVIKTPKLNLYQQSNQQQEEVIQFDFNKHDCHPHTPKFIRTSSFKNINYSCLTPKLDDFLNKSIESIHDSKSNLNIEKSVLLIQRKWRYNQFSKSLKILKQNLLIKSVLLIQRKWRYRKFRKCLKYLKEQNDYEIRLKLKYTLLIQKCFRIKKIKRKELENNSARIIQHKWRLFRFRQEMNKYRCSAKIIQNFYKNQIKPRLNFLKLKSICLKIEAIYIGKKTRREHLLKKESCMKIQYWFRAKLVRLNFLKLKSSCIKIQRFYRYKKFSHCLNKFRTSLIKIQKWTRSMKQRFEYLNYKRVVLKCVVKIQTYWRCYKSKQILKQLKQEKLFYKSALKIQTLWKCYKSKLILKQFKQEKLMNKSALKIQSYWKCFKSRQQLNNAKKQYLSAIKIQAYWKGYRTRKENGEILKCIRNKLNVLSESNLILKGSTLGSRIKNSLDILKYPYVAIQQIILALTELDKVTRLSPECCLIFSQEKAVDILYNFILNCNRSVPHMDLIKLCIRVFINLAKYSLSSFYVLENSQQLNILLNLFQAYQISNPQIFIDVCILFILLAQNAKLKDYLNKNDLFIKKLNNAHLNFKSKSRFNHNNNNNNNSKKLMANSSNCFNVLPDWALTKNIIYFEDPLSILELLINKLAINPTNKIRQDNNKNTPKKLGLIKPVKSIKLVKTCLNIEIESKQKLNSNNDDIDDSRVSIISNFSYLSTFNLNDNIQHNEYPKMNSTFLSFNSNN